MRFPTARLPIGKSGSHALAEDGLNQWLGSELVHQLVGGDVIEGMVEAEGMVLQVVSKVHLLFGLVHHDHFVRGDDDDIQVLHGGLLLVERPPPHADADAVVLQWLRARQLAAVQAPAAFLDHALNLVVGVSRVDSQGALSSALQLQQSALLSLPLQFLNFP